MVRKHPDGSMISTSTKAHAKPIKPIRPRCTLSKGLGYRTIVERSSTSSVDLVWNAADKSADVVRMR